MGMLYLMKQGNLLHCGEYKDHKNVKSVLVRWLRAGKTEWAHALAGGLFVWGAEGSFAGLTANVPEAGNTCGERLRVTD